MNKLNRIRNWCQKKDYLFLIICTIIYELVIYFFDNLIYLFSGLFIVFVICMLFNKNRIIKNIFYLIYIIGVIIRTKYIIDTDINVRQHDVLSINSDGHLDYIKYIYDYYRLPESNSYQFYHPPLWHMIAAFWLKINSLLNISIDKAIEGIQIITVIISSSMIILADKIAHKIKITDYYILLVDYIVSTISIMIIFSGSINNDCLLLFFYFLIIYLLIIWDENPSWGNTINLAISTGLCVMTKASGGLIAVPILYIFISKIIDSIKNNNDKIKSIINKIISFGLFSLPIGLWFEVYFYFKYKMFPSIPIPGLIRISNPLGERLFRLDILQLRDFSHILLDNNLPAHLIKTSIVGEWPILEASNVLTTLVLIKLLLVIISVGLIIYYLFKKNKNKYMNVLIIFWIVSIVSEYIFVYKYPYICTMDYRYIAFCLFPETMIVVYSLTDIKHKYLKMFIIGLYILFIILNMYFCLRYY